MLTPLAYQDAKKDGWSWICLTCVRQLLLQVLVSCVIRKWSSHCIACTKLAHISWHRLLVFQKMAENRSNNHRRKTGWEREEISQWTSQQPSDWLGGLRTSLLISCTEGNDTALIPSPGRFDDKNLNILLHIFFGLQWLCTNWCVGLQLGRARALDRNNSLPSFYRPSQLGWL